MKTSKARLSDRIVLGGACLFGLALIGLAITGGHPRIPFVHLQSGWSIGIYSGESPTHVHDMDGVHNPVLTAADVSDIRANFVADPFMIFESGKWYLFFEAKNAATQRGEIALATSPDLTHWTYQQVVLAEPFHLSYPYVFQWNGKHYMVPESYQADSVRLYEASDFPKQWHFVTNLISNVQFADSSLVRYNDKWWLFTSTTNHSFMSIYYADELAGPWKAHPNNPVICNDPSSARPGGRVLIQDGKITRFVQIDVPTYGYGLRAFQVTELTPSTFVEREIPDFRNLMATGSKWAWNGEGMHTLDAHCLGDGRWVACVDGTGRMLRFGRN